MHSALTAPARWIIVSQVRMTNRKEGIRINLCKLAFNHDCLYVVWSGGVPRSAACHQYLIETMDELINVSILNIVIFINCTILMLYT